MTNQIIGLSGEKFRIVRVNASDPIHGIHSGKELAALELEIIAVGEEVKILEKLLKDPTVQVDDPIASRCYEASATLKSSSHTQGRPERYYTIMLKEADVIPDVQQIEIDGEPYPVIKYTEKAFEGAPARFALLRLTDEQLSTLRRSFRPGPIPVARVGVDTAPLSCRFGGAMFWSRHEDAAGRFYKHIVRLFPVDHTSKIGPLFVDTREYNSLVRMHMALSARFEALLEHLTATGAITGDKRKEFMDESWKTLVSETRLVEMNQEIRRLADAEPEL